MIIASESLKWSGASAPDFFLLGEFLLGKFFLKSAAVGNFYC